MPGKPYQSRLNPYRDRIAELRRPWPPTPYKEIAAILNAEHPGLEISPNAVWSFVKKRALGPSKKQYRLPENEPVRPIPGTRPQPETQPHFPSQMPGQAKQPRPLTAPEPETHEDLFPK